MVGIADQDDRSAVANQRRRAAQQAQNRSQNPEEDLSSIIDTNQQLLIQNMRTAIETSTLLGNSIETLRAPGLQGTDADLISYYGPPEDLINKMVKPPEARHFVHATQAQLSVLEPLLRFFIVNKDGTEREVYFSDYTSEERLLKLASLRRGNSIEESLERQEGSNVGIQRFAWEYHNKHEGDKIVQASLDLYFGSLADLVNVNYLQFLFTNGLKNPEAPPLGRDEAQNNTLQKRILALREEIQRRKPFLRGGGTNPDASETSISEKSVKDNFRQLKVVVGWAIPKGRRSELVRLFRGGNVSGFGAGGRSGPTNKLKSFLRGVKATQRILLLNLRTYDVDFAQNGSVKLSIQYVASSDNYMAKPGSDVLGSNNFTAGNLNEVEVGASARNLDGDKIWPEGYLDFVVKSGGLQGAKQNRKIYVQLSKLREESDILQLEIKLRQLRNEANNRTSTDKTLELLKQYDKTVGEVYNQAKKELKYQRYQAFMNRLIDQKHIYMLDAIYNSQTQEVTVKPATSVDAASREDIAKWLRNTVRLSKRKKKSKLKQRNSEDNIFQKNIPGRPSYMEDDAQGRNQKRKIIYVRLGDLLKVAMELAGMREDSNFIMGSFYPSQAGVPGYAPDDTDDYEMIYDIPISLEYFGQFFYKNVVLPERDEWTFREFYTSLLSLVTQVLNRVTDYQLRVQFGWTTFSTYSNLLPPSGIMEGSFLNRVQNSIANEPYKQSRPVNSYYVMYAKQLSHRSRNGNRKKDEKDGIYYYTIGASRGLAKEFNFKAQDVPQFQAMNIEATKDRTVGLSRALILPQNVDIEMYGNSLHRNGDMIAVDSRQALGSYANSILTLGGYYRVVSSTHTITTAGYHTTLGCVFERRFSG